MDTKDEQAFKEISEICKNSLRDSNKRIYLEKILNWCHTHNHLTKNVWYQNGIPLLLLQEVIYPYNYLNKKTFTKDISHNVSITIQILEYLVQDDDIKKMFVDSNFHYYIFSYITLYDLSNLYEEPRICVLKLLNTLIPNIYVQSQIKNTELIPIILKNIDLGSCECKCLSMEIFYTIINTDEGLNFVSQTFDRFSAVNQVFNSIFIYGLQCKSYDVIKWILKVYIKLCDKEHIRKALKLKGADNMISSEMNRWIIFNNECSALYKKFKEILNN